MTKTSYITIDSSQEDAFYSNLQPDDRLVFGKIRVKKTIFSRKSKSGISQRSLLPQIAALWAGFSDLEKEAWSDAAAAGALVLYNSREIGVIANFGTCEIGYCVYGKQFPVSSLNGWRLFVRDQCYRVKNDIAGVATPSLLHQDLLGNLKIEVPADEIKIAQYHPAFYWINHKVYGSKNMYEPVKITEPL